MIPQPLVDAATDYLKVPTPERRMVLASMADEFVEHQVEPAERSVWWALKQAWTAAEHEQCSLLAADDGSLP